MATIYKHGEIGQIERIDHKLAYCEDGQVLRNQGDGWKVWKKVKAGLNPRQVYTDHATKYAAKIRDNPMYAAWRELFHATIPFRFRFLALQAISMMPEDSDGVCSEVNDFACLNGGVEIISFEEAAQLCSAYNLAMNEARAKKNEEHATA